MADRRIRLVQTERLRALAWVDAWFTLNSAIKEPMLRNVALGKADRVVIDPFDPRQIEPGELGNVMEAVRAFAAGHRVHLWLVAPASAKTDLGEAGLIQQAQQSIATVRRTQAAESLAISPVQLPPVPIWAGNATVFRPSTAAPLR